MWPVPILGSGRDGGGYGATVTGVGQPESTQQIAVGDVWDALEGASFQITKQATGRRLLTGPAEQTIFLHGRDLVGFRVASQSLLAELAGWGIQPVASGKYPPPPGGEADAKIPYSALPQQPQA